MISQAYVCKDDLCFMFFLCYNQLFPASLSLVHLQFSFFFCPFSFLSYVVMCPHTQKKRKHTHTKKKQQYTRTILINAQTCCIIHCLAHFFFHTFVSQPLFFLLKRRQHTKNKEPFFSVDLLSFASKYTLLLPTVAFPCSCFLFFLLIN